MYPISSESYEALPLRLEAKPMIIITIHSIIDGNVADHIIDDRERGKAIDAFH